MLQLVLLCSCLLSCALVWSSCFTLLLLCSQLCFTPVYNCVYRAPTCAPACFPLHLCVAPALLCSQLCITPEFNCVLRACHAAIQSRHQTLISSQFTNFYPESSLQPYLQLLPLNRTPFTLYKNGFSASLGHGYAVVEHHNVELMLELTSKVFLMSKPKILSKVFSLAKH